MPRTRLDHERLESRYLAPYACQPSQSRGRVHDEEPHPFRSAFQRDRERVVHSRAFRRLEYKSQVFLNGAGDHYRTRLTHTMEVASIARSVARSLNLNEDLAEGISLAHDLGHPPFGHPGETALHACLKQHGGFEHNRQSLRLVEELEMKYPEFNGLNLTWEVRDGINKHGPREFGFFQSSLEGQAADLSDQIAYCCHDLDDALDSGLVLEEGLKPLEIWQVAETTYLKKYTHLDPDRRRNYLSRCLLNYLIYDALDDSAPRLRTGGLESADDVRKQKEKLIRNSPDVQRQKTELLAFLRQHFYQNPAVAGINQRAVQCLQQLFELYVSRPHLLGNSFQVRIKKEGVHRAAGDYLACMTDRFALQEYEKLIGEAPKILTVGLRQDSLL